MIGYCEHGRRIFHGCAECEAVANAEESSSAESLPATRKTGVPATPPDEYMCPNCVTPWKCNGPHIPDASPTDRGSTPQDSTVDRDAARYRWLRDSLNMSARVELGRRDSNDVASWESWDEFYDDELDRAIDTAMAKESKA